LSSTTMKRAVETIASVQLFLRDALMSSSSCLVAAN
jgi:hypothetical protein